MKGAANEVATVFVQTLSKALAAPAGPIKASAPYPTPTPVGSKCDSTLLSAASVDPSAVRKKLEDWRKELGQLFD